MRDIKNILKIFILNPDLKNLNNKKKIKKYVGEQVFSLSM
jgi:hypothetical protein